MRASGSAMMVPKSYSSKNGSKALIPSIVTRVWLASAPRMRISVSPPTAPVRLTATPGTSRSTSETTSVWRCCRAWSSITVTEATDQVDRRGVAGPGGRRDHQRVDDRVMRSAGCSAGGSAREGFVSGAAQGKRQQAGVKRYLGIEAPPLSSAF